MSIELVRYGLDQRIIDILEDKNITRLRTIQKKALMEGLLNGTNLLVIAPSASGKTMIGEIAMIQKNLKSRKKSVYLVPLRAIAYEKYEYFLTTYSPLGVKISISTGDFDSIPEELVNADIMILTYERFDSLLRGRPDWLKKIGIVVIDEIHNINDYYRGPRLENVIARMKFHLPNVQLIALSATIANPKEFANWLGCELIEYNVRPVRLEYRVLHTEDKIKEIHEIIKQALRKNGQVLIFVKTRKESRELIQNLPDLMYDENLLGAKEVFELRQFFKQVDLTKLTKVDKNLVNLAKYGVAYHNAGLALESRKMVEELFKKRLIKVIACTTTLAAGVNLPAYAVVIKDCQIVTFDPNILSSDDHNWYRNQLDKNVLHQILGRAGRPIYDKIGWGIILTPTKADANRIVSYYFNVVDKKFIPKYDEIKSQMNQREVLYEQVLVRLLERGELTDKEILNDFKDTFWWYKSFREDPSLSIEQIIEIGAVSILKTIGELTTEEIRQKANSIPDEQVEITRANDKIIEAIVKDRITHTCSFYQEYPSCTCREFKFNEETHKITLCRHLIKLIYVGLKKFPRITNDLACLALQREFILDSLIKMKLITPISDKYKLTPFGTLVATLYIKPSSAIVIKSQLSNMNELIRVIETVNMVCVADMSRYMDKEFTQLIFELVERPTEQSLDFKIREVSERYYKGLGDIEEYIEYTLWIAHAISKIAELFGFSNVVKLAKYIIRKLKIDNN